MITVLCLSICCLGSAHWVCWLVTWGHIYITQCCVMGEIAKIAQEEGRYVCMAWCHAASQGLYKWVSSIRLAQLSADLAVLIPGWELACLEISQPRQTFSSSFDWPQLAFCTLCPINTLFIFCFIIKQQLGGKVTSCRHFCKKIFAQLTSWKKWTKRV